LRRKNPRRKHENPRENDGDVDAWAFERVETDSFAYDVERFGDENVQKNYMMT